MTNTTEIDWSKAPEGATHYHSFVGMWYKHNGLMYFFINEECGWEESSWSFVEIEHLLTPRPASAEVETAISTETHSIEPKPLLDLTPKNIWEEQMQHQRRQDIHAAMQRYIEAGKDIPNEWLYELAQLNLALQKIETDFSEAIQTLPASDEGWVEWGKEEEPDIPDYTVVEKVYSDGDARTGCNSSYMWFGSLGRDGKPYVVTRYRIISEGGQE